MKRIQHGFTLIELMVGVALGLLATVVIAQVFLQSEGNKRATTSGSDAQVVGASALYTMQRDIQAAGYGLSAWGAGLGCPLSGALSGTTVLNPATDVLAPVVIGFGASASASDTVTVLSSGKTGHAVPIKVTSEHAAIDPKFVVTSNLGVAANDFMLAVPAAWAAGNGCTLFMATASSVSTEIPHATSSNWNASTAIYPSAGYPAGSVLLNLGAAPVRRRYSVNATSWSLQVQDLLTVANNGAAQETFPQVVLLKALYGMTDPAGGAVTSYTASPASLSTNNDWRRVQAIRVVLVARSGQYERLPVTKVQPQWPVGNLVSAGTVNCTLDASTQCINLDVSASGSANVTEADGTTGKVWQHYRYKVFDTVIPLRNVVWNP